jgi:hypothetical protein
MLKNKTKELIKNKFKQIPRLDQLVMKNNLDTYEKEIDDEHTDCNNINNSAIIDVPNYLESPVFKSSKTLLICLFQIVTEGSSPFLLYLLHNKKTTNELQLITMHSFDGGKYNENLTEEAVDYMYNLLEPIHNKVEISYAGFTETATNNILFMKYISPINNSDGFSLPSDYYWATTHELVNLNSVMNIHIALNVIHFFINNPELLHLTNEDDVIYETPVIGYYNTNNDIYREKRIEKYEKCYYFDIKYTNDGITRAVLFLKRTGLLNDDFNNFDSIVYNNKDMHYYLIKSYAQHTVI